MATDRSGDVLAGALESFRQLAERRKILCIPGFVSEDDEHVPVVQVVADVANEGATAHGAMTASVQSFLRILEQADVAMLVILAETLTIAEWEKARAACGTAIDAVRNPEPDEPAVDADRSAAALETLGECLREVEAARRHLDQVGLLSVRAITRDPTVVLHWMESTPWHDVVWGVDERIAQAENALDDDDEEDEDTPEQLVAQRAFEELQRQRSIWTPQKRKEVARQLAEHRDFPRCRSEAERVYLLDKLLGEETPPNDYMKKEMAREASAVYKLDIAPKAR